jgi:hypothetical protein
MCCCLQDVGGLDARSAKKKHPAVLWLLALLSTPLRLYMPMTHALATAWTRPSPTYLSSSSPYMTRSSSFAAPWRTASRS